MPTRVHAIIVARPGATSRAQLLHTLDALALQTRRADAITLVVCGDASSIRDSSTVAHSVEGIIEARASTSFADAVALALPRVAQGAAVWLLAHDTAPHPRALGELTGALERSPSAALAAPKLVSADSEREIVSLGVTMTTFGRTVDSAGGELDQGQHDGAEDALGADVRGLLLRGEVTATLMPDPALAGADEGLDLGVRARLAGGRTVLAPRARISVHPDGPAALPQSPSRRAFATRLAQLHRRLVYAPAVAVPLHWLTFLPLALWRSLVHLVAKRPADVLPEWGAAITAMARIGAVARSRGRLRAVRTQSWSSITPLRVTHSQLRKTLDDGHGSEGGAVSELRFFSGGGAWVVLGALLVSAASFTLVFAWPALGGGGLLPLRDTVVGLWQDASWGLRGLGVDVVGPADPFAGVLAVLGSLFPAAPSLALVAVWVLALPLAVLGGWFAATRITDRGGLRIFAGVVWALSPTFLTALVDGRPAAVLVHLLLPWLFHTAAVARRSWGAAGAGSLILAAVLACAPSLAPAAVVLWIVTLGIVLGQGSLRGAVRVLWLVVPSAVIFAPLAIWQVQRGSIWALFADPGLIFAGPQVAADAAGRLLLAGGFPTSDMAGWSDILSEPLAAWVPLLCAPLAVLALASALSPRWRAGATLLLVGLAGLATACLAVGIEVSFAQGAPVAIWPGTGLSLGWLGVVGAAVVTLETGLRVPRARALAATVAAIAIVVCAVPSLAAMHAGRSALTNGPETTLPAFVAAEARGDQSQSTLVLTAQNDGTLATRVVWGASDTLGAQTTVLSTATTPRGTDVSTLAVDLISARDFDALEQLAQHGVHFVLLDQIDGDETDAARALRVGAVTALDQRVGFVKVGETDKGVLWRLDTDPAPRADLTGGQQRTAQLFTTLTLLVLLSALLLSVPTRASRRAARAQSRIVGRAPEEPAARRRRDVDDLALPVVPEHPGIEEFPDAAAPIADADEEPEDEEPEDEAGSADEPDVERTEHEGDGPADETDYRAGPPDSEVADDAPTAPERTEEER